jgi:pimeloyl-ACP methyl ester carboxylesterase
MIAVALCFVTIASASVPSYAATRKTTKSKSKSKVASRTKAKTRAKVTKPAPKKKAAPTTVAPLLESPTESTTTVAPTPIPTPTDPATATTGSTATGTTTPTPTTLVGQPLLAPPAVAGAALGIERATFETCAEVECARVKVPRNYSDPNGERITLFVSRRKARVPESRIGTLFLNPGGPGGATFDLVRSANELVSPNVLDRFDIIGVDPRGTERSTALTCGARRTSYDRSVIDATPREAQAIRITYLTIAQRCRDAEGTRLDYMDTETAARDLDAIRESLGEDTISYLGISYGTYLGAMYANLFPTRTRAAILDSAIDPNRFGAPIVVDRFEAVEKALDAFLAACSSGRLNPCNFNDGTDLSAKFLELRNRQIQKGPIEAYEFDDVMQSLLGYPRNGWPILGRAMQELWTKGRADFRQLPTDNKQIREPSSIQPFDTFSSATNIAVNCRDGIIPRDIESYKSARAAIPTVGPRFSALVDDSLVAITCLDWASPVAPRVNFQPTASVMVIANTFDLVTPIRWSEGLAATLASPLLIREGGGHGAVDKSACVRDYVARFLVDGQRIADRTVCAELVWQ